MSNEKRGDFRDLVVWQKGMVLARDTYIFASTLPKEEKYGIISQIKRAAVSIPSNIAEGHGRNSSKEFTHFLSISRGSLNELVTQIELAVMFDLVKRQDTEEIFALSEEVARLLRGLQKSLKIRRSDHNLHLTHNS